MDEPIEMSRYTVLGEKERLKKGRLYGWHLYVLILVVWAIYNIINAALSCGFSPQLGPHCIIPAIHLYNGHMVFAIALVGTMSFGLIRKSGKITPFVVAAIVFVLTALLDAALIVRPSNYFPFPTLIAFCLWCIVCAVTCLYHAREKASVAMIATSLWLMVTTVLCAVLAFVENAHPEARLIAQLIMWFLNASLIVTYCATVMAHTRKVKF